MPQKSIRPHKMGFDEVMKRISGGQFVYKSGILSSALDRTVWQVTSNVKGCRPNYSSVCQHKGEAAKEAMLVAGTHIGIAPKGMSAHLKQGGDELTFEFRDRQYKIKRMTLREALS